MNFRKKQWGLLVLGWIVFSLLVVPCALAQSSIFFGPKRYDKPKGGPLTYSETIRTTYLGARYTLRVTSGEYGAQEAKNVSVTLNGVEMIDPAMMRAGNPVETPVTLQAENLLTVRMKGQGGNFVTLELLCDGCTPIRITSPADGESLQTPVTTVQGELGCIADANTGVVVNGVAALIDGTHFIATHVTPDSSSGLLKADLVNDSGAVIASAQVAPRLDPASNFMVLSTDRSSGIAPLEASLTLTESNIPLFSSTVTCAGPTTAPVQRLGLDSYMVDFDQPGLYLCTALAKDASGNDLIDRIGILVYDQAVLDALLQAKWSGMKTALANGEVDRASGYFNERTRSIYRTYFEQLTTILPQAVADMGNATLLRADEDVAIYDLRTVRNGNIYSFQLEFIRDGDGIWRINRF